MFSFFSRKKIPVSVVTGFLGSGKTTLVNGLLSHDSFKNTAVIINEFGDVGIDHLLVEQVDEKMVLLSKGCICCAVRADILTTIRDLLKKQKSGAIPPFKRILIETTGLADPAPVVHALTNSPLGKNALYMDTVVSTMDALLGESTLKTHEELLRQIAVADVLVLTKTDQATPAQAARASELASSINPTADLVRSEQGHLDPKHFFGNSAFNPSRKKPDIERWLRAGQPQAGHHAHPKHPDINSFTIEREEPLTMQSFQMFHETLVNFKEAKLLRMKGVLNIASAKGPVVIHGVQHVISPPRWLDRWPTKDRRSRLVFITRGISKESIDGILSAFERTAVATLRQTMGAPSPRSQNPRPKS